MFRTRISTKNVLFVLEILVHSVTDHKEWVFMNNS